MTRRQKDIPRLYPQQHLSVPASWWGRLFLWFLRGYLGPRYTLVVRPRGVRPLLGRVYLVGEWIGYVRRSGGVAPNGGYLRLLAYDLRYASRVLHRDRPLWVARRWGVYIKETEAAKRADTRREAERQRSLAEWQTTRKGA